MILTNKERRAIESRILHRIQRGASVLYKSPLEKALYEYLVAVQAAKDELYTKLSDIDYMIDNKESKENEKENIGDGDNGNNNNNFGWRAVFG